MNFLGNTLRAAVPGATRLAMAVGAAGGPAGSYQRGYDQELQVQSRIAQAAAASRLHNLEADEKEEEAQRRTPEALLDTALTANGIPTDEAGAVNEYLKTGVIGGKYRPLPSTLQGPVAPAPDWQGRLGAVARSVGTQGQALTVGDKSVFNLAKAEGERREQSMADDVVRGKLDPTLFAQSQYAAKGNAPYSFKEYGVGNNLTGKVDDSAAPAQRFGQLRTQETAQARAGAAENYAQAESARATAAKTREETQRGARSGDIIEVTQPDGTLLLVNKVNGLSRPVIGADGKPVMGKGAIPPGVAPDEDRARLSSQLGVPVAPADPFRNMTVKGQEAMRKTVYEKADKRIAEMEQQARVDANMATQVSRFVDLQSKTGGLQQGPVMGRIPGLSDAAQELDAITDYLTPKMREPGSGATSDFDARMFRNATVSRTKDDPVNAAIAEGVKARAQMSADRAQFMRDYLTVNGHLDGAERYWAQYAGANPIFDPRFPQRPVMNRNRRSYQEYFRAGAAPRQSNAVAPQGSWGEPATQPGWSIRKVN